MRTLLLSVAIAASTCSTAAPLPTPVIHADFDDLAKASKQGGLHIKTQFPTPDTVPGVVGTAWRTDGFSSYAEANLVLEPPNGLTISFWVALESYPSDLEVPVKDLVPSSFVQQTAGDRGFDLFIDAYGRWGLKVATSAGTLLAKA